MVVPNINLSSDSSQRIAALSPVVPLSIIIPESFTFAVVKPSFKLIILSATFKWVVLTVVASPLIVKLPVIVTLPLAAISVAAILPSTSNLTPAVGALPIPTSPVEMTFNLVTLFVLTENWLTVGNPKSVPELAIWRIFSFICKFNFLVSDLIYFSNKSRN